jgi:hypothetical protein
MFYSLIFDLLCKKVRGLSFGAWLIDLLGTDSLVG